MTSEAVSDEDFHKSIQDDNEIKDKEDPKEDMSTIDSHRHMTLEAWTAKGRDPDDWRSPEVFKERGRHIEQIKRLKEDTEQRLQNQNLLHQLRLEDERAAAVLRRDEAFEITNKKQFDIEEKRIQNIDKQMDLVKDPPPEQKNSAAVNAWNSENSWIFDANDERTKVAMSVYAECIEDGLSESKALKYVDKEIERVFTKKITERSQKAEGSRSVSAKSEGSSNLNFNQLTQQELAIWDTGRFKGTKEQFVKAALDSRSDK